MVCPFAEKNLRIISNIRGNVLYRLLVGKPEGKRPLEDQDVGGWITLRWTF
jgi:hypothetical protein